MNNFAIAIVAALTATAYAFRCTNLTVPVNLSARNGVFNMTTPQNNVDVTNLILDLTRQGGSFVEQRVQVRPCTAITASPPLTVPQTSTALIDRRGLTTVWDSIVHIGTCHTYWDLPYNGGNSHVYALTAMDPNISDGIALTGFSQNGSFVPYFALGANFVDVKTNPLLAPQYDHGYLATGDLPAFQANFLGPEQFDPAVLAFAATIRQPLAIGEILTIGSEIASLNTFKGPVLVVTGEHDVPFCGGSCYNGASPNSSIPASAGHALNLEYSHPFRSINEFCKQNDKA
ncbi:hypothetical protein LTR22_028062 [Elasticomyces elasticus]|nr:hypothetical protein LTR22_028062 [Elasticomyces elasticus]